MLPNKSNSKYFLKANHFLFALFVLGSLLSTFTVKFPQNLQAVNQGGGSFAINSHLCHHRTQVRKTL